MRIPKPPNIKIMLTVRQVDQLRPFFDRVKAAAVMGSPGMLVGQISWNDQDGTFYITPAFLPHEKAKVIAEAGAQLEEPAAAAIGDTNG